MKKKETKEKKEKVDYELERDRITLKYSMLLVFVGTAVAGMVENMSADGSDSTAAIVAVCIVLLIVDRGIRWLVSRRLNRMAEKNGDPIPFDKKHMI